MDPLTALGLAANVLEFIDFTSKILKAGKTIYNEGTSEENKSQELVIADLEKLREKLRSFSRATVNGQGPLTQDEQALQLLSEECIRIASEFHNALSQLNLGPDRTKLDSIGQAPKMAWKAGKIRETIDRTNAIRDEIQFRLILSIKSSINDFESSVHAAKISFDDTTSRIVTAMLLQQDTLTMTVRQTTDSVSHGMSITDEAAQRRHLEVLTAINQRSPNASPIPATWIESTPDPLMVHNLLMRALNFSEKDDRLNDIDIRHHKTFDWIYAARMTSQPPWDDLSRWLRNGQGAYWISGKAGSGKSTLMKLLEQDRRTKASLSEWAAGSQLITLRFFFWSLGGADLHKSTIGLTKSLLYQAIHQKSELGRISFSAQYEADAVWEGFPTRIQARRALELLLDLDDPTHKLFLLIDGLDEFEDFHDDQEDLAIMLLNATKKPTY